MPAAAACSMTGQGAQIAAESHHAAACADWGVVPPARLLLLLLADSTAGSTQSHRPRVLCTYARATGRVRWVR
jgi:hypothetical protein